LDEYDEDDGEDKDEDLSTWNVVFH
jgi:hypothetical protein